MNEARALTHRLADLLRRERAALSEFLLALANFDRERRWRELGHTSLFYFLHRELALSKSAAFYRKTAAELVQRYPEIIEPLRDGRLCLTSITELAKVLTPENRAEVVPRFFQTSKWEAKAVAAELKPVEAAPARVVVTALPTRAASREVSDHLPHAGVVLPEEPLCAKFVAPPEVLRPPQPTRSQPPARDEAEPLTAELRRLHITVSKRFLAKLDAARDALSHSHPAADAEAVLEAALDLLLEKHARKKGLVKKPRATPARPSERSRHIPAEVKRKVWERDGGRCQYRFASGETCGSTRRLQLDHVVPVAHGGPSSVENLRITCAAHNLLAARQVFGDLWMDRYIRSAGQAP